MNSEHYDATKRSAKTLSNTPTGAGSDALDALTGAAKALAGLNDFDACYWDAFKHACRALATCNTLEDLEAFEQAISLGREP